MKVKVKVWLELNGENVMGDGRLSLLKSIEDCGSLRAAAEKHGISYRHAWGQLKKIETRLGVKLFEPTTGGVGGGGMKLTAKAKELMADYERMREDIDSYVRKKYPKFTI